MLFDGGRGKRREMAAAGYGIVLNAWDRDSVSETRRRVELSYGTYGALQRWAMRSGTVLMIQPVILLLNPEFPPRTGRDDAPLLQLRAIPCSDRAACTYSWPFSMGREACLPFVISSLALRFQQRAFPFPSTLSRAPPPPPPPSALPLPGLDQGLKASTDFCFPDIWTKLHGEESMRLTCVVRD
ncbi:hypothetical protein FSARC_5852 [Fusarium sarcochroum]|uniref:Uncharacterized protein n=1 Tax=Fusarium sarcochroum TaxID=1208366 RepID=A0A8H4XA03_9HYPO|nr:hypothetical protein FSARC_5852 [Fusarium sarcochroum]